MKNRLKSTSAAFWRRFETLIWKGFPPPFCKLPVVHASHTSREEPEITLPHRCHRCWARRTPAPQRGIPSHHGFQDSNGHPRDWGMTGGSPVLETSRRLGLCVRVLWNNWFGEPCPRWLLLLTCSKIGCDEIAVNSRHFPQNARTIFC